MVSTPTSAVKLDVGALEAPLRAKMKLAQAQGGLAAAIGEVGQVAGQFGQDMQKAKNLAIAADADRQMRQATADFQSSLVNRADEKTGDKPLDVSEKWGQEWQAKALAVRDKIYASHSIGPDLKAHLDQQIANWGQSNAIEVKTVARKEFVKRSIDSLHNASVGAAKDSDEKTIVNLWTQAANDKLIYPEQKKDYIDKYLNRSEEYKARTYIDNMPADSVDFLTAKNDKGDYENLTRLDPDQRDRLIGRAYTMRNKFYADNVEQAMAQLDPNSEVPLTDADVDAGVKMNQWETSDARRLKQMISGKIAQEDKSLSGEIMSEAAEYNPTDDKNKEQYYSILKRAQGLSKKSAIVNLLEKRNKEGAVGDDGLAVVNQLFNAKVFGDWMVPDPAQGGKMKKDNALWLKANQVRHELQDQLAADIQANAHNPKYSKKSQRDFISGAAQKFIDSATVMPVFDALTGETK